MQRRRFAVVVNPTSGRGAGRRMGARATARLAAAGHDVVDLTSQTPAEAEDRARSLVHDVDALVVVGGDGLVNLGVNVVAGTGTPLGVVAAGTGNDVADSLGLPVSRPEQAADVVLAGHVREVDAVRRTDDDHRTPRWYAGVLCGGFDAIVNERANGWVWPRGRMRYNLAIARELPVFRPLPYRLELDGEPWVTEAMLVAVANGRSYGGGMRVTPDARMDDGLLDVLVVGPLSVPALARVFPKVFRGEHTSHPAVTIRRARRVRLETAGVVAYADGERFGPLPVEVEVVPSALRVLAPPGA
ncbi:diacylglycerol kinase [Angustibacter aerolatus]